MTITVVGLGPGTPAHLTLEADRFLRSAGRVYMRTGRHPCLDYLLKAGVSVETFDDLYEKTESLAEVHEQIAGRILDLDAKCGGHGDIVFAVPGHPLMGEAAVALILNQAEKDGRSVRIIQGLSFIESAITALGIDPLDGLQIVDGLDLVRKPFPVLDTDRGVLIGQVYSRQVASDVKLTLGELYPDEHTVTLVQVSDAGEALGVSLPLFEMDRQPGIDHQTSLYVPALPSSGSWFGLQEIVARLRAPGGCPWDREQTHRTLRTHLLDETYEVLDALDRDDMDDLRAELGDLALQIALHMQIAVEQGEFTPTDVFAGIISKLRRRHPHVFGDVQVNGASDVMANWEQIKREERGERDNSHQLDGVPASLPALAQALTYQHRAERVGHEVKNGDHLMELMEEWVSGPDPGQAERVLGDLLFALVASSWESGVDLNPESALRQANARFAEQFKEAQLSRGPVGENVE